MKKISKMRWIKNVFPLMVSMFLSLTLLAQSGTTIEVKGVVKDNIGPLAGASVVVKGTIRGVSTGFDGDFTLNVPKGSTLVVSYVGFVTKEVQAAENLTIMLSEDAELLDEVVVIGYGTVKKTDLTGSLTAIKVDEKNRGAVTSPQDLIQGKISGVFIQPPNGQPGGSSTIRIRSGASLNASNDPLIVIDGVPVSNDAAPGMANGLASINPNDIETFTVLKDASATAIYGSRASNGVILITTKKGGKDLFKISYNATFSINDPYKKLKTLGADQFREVAKNTYTGSLNEGTNNLLNIFPSQSTNWQDEIFKTAFGTDQNLSIGGTAFNTPYRVSFGYNKEFGTLKTSEYERYTLDVSLNPKFLDDHLSVSINAKGVINNNVFADTGAVGAAAFYDPTKPVYNPSQPHFNGYWNWVANANAESSAAGQPSVIGTPNGQASANPMQSLFDKFDTGKTKRSLGNIQLDYKVHWLPELRLNLNLAYDVAKGKGNKGPNMGSFDAMKDDLFKGVGRRESWDNFRRNTLLEYYMSYDKEIERIKSRFSVMGGYSYQRFYYSDFSQSYSPKVNWFLPDLDKNAWKETEDAYVRTDAYRRPKEYYLVSFFGRANYIFMDRYMLTGTLRRDGTSRFSKDNRWGNFTSLAAAWTISEESFMKNIKPLSNLKLRLGYGSTGQQDVGDDFYQYYAAYLTSTNQESLYLGEYLLKPGKYNKDLRWEKTDTYNIGVDFGFLSNRIYGSIEYYQKKTKDLLGMVDIPAGTNFTNKLVTNIGKMENQGVEFNINAVVVDTKDFTWNTGFNITWNESEITKLIQQGNDSYEGIAVGGIGIGTGSRIQRHKVGYTPYTYEVYKQVYDADGKPIQGAFVDLDEDGEITQNDRYLTKSPMPKIYLGFNSMLRFKEFDFGFNLRANVGNYVYNEVAAMNSSTININGGMGFLTNLHRTALETGFTGANSVPQATSDYFLENASFLKMDNLTFGYNFSNFMKSGLSGRLSFTVQNVFTITKYKGLDPENSGIDGTIWPRPRTYTFGVNLNF